MPANGTRLALGLDQAPEPAAGPTAAPAVPGEEAARVFIHYDADAASASAAAAALYARLAEAAAYATVVLRDVPYAIGNHRVRYYHAADRPAAMALIERLGSPPGTDWQLQDFRQLPAPAGVRGTLEARPFRPTGSRASRPLWKQPALGRAELPGDAAASPEARPVHAEPADLAEPPVLDLRAAIP
ncbi:MAG: hypothetical protein R3D25_16135 [Geminicoccaceae bacterium]